MWFFVHKRRLKVVNLDMDGPITNYVSHWGNIWTAKYPDRFCPDLSRIETFYIQDNFPPELKDDVWAIDKQPDFFLSLPAVPGALEAMKRMRAIEHVRVKICTSPVPSPYGMMEKYFWVERNLGPEWIADLIQTRDKTQVKGRYLIDDRPDITGLFEPEWEHLVFDASYNKKTPGRRVSWTDYEWFIDELKHR